MLVSSKINIFIINLIIIALIFQLYNNFIVDSKKELVILNNHIDNTIDIWFTIIDGNTPAYHMQLKIALTSARVYTTLIPIVIFLGENKKLEDWLIENNIIVYKNINNFKIVNFFKDSKEYLGHLGLATWLRLIIPEVIANLKGPENRIIKDLEHKMNRTISLDYILCTDVDLFFSNKFSPSIDILPRYVSFAVQGNNHIRTDNVYSSTFHLNAGVMILNASSSSEWEEEFHDFSFKQIKLRNGPKFKENVFEDQGAFQGFFPPRLRTKTIVDYVYMFFYHRTYFGYLFAKYYSSYLPKEYEWEPYLGVNLDAVIIHWHGPKFYYPDDCTEIYSPIASSKYNHIIHKINSTQEEIIELSSKSRRVLTGDLLDLTPQSTEGYKHATVLLYKYLNILCKRENITS